MSHPVELKYVGKPLFQRSSCDVFLLRYKSLLGFKINFHNKSKCILHVRLISIKQNPLNFDGITRNFEIRCLKNF